MLFEPSESVHPRSLSSSYWSSGSSLASDFFFFFFFFFFFSEEVAPSFDMDIGWSCLGWVAGGSGNGLWGSFGCESTLLPLIVPRWTWDAFLLWWQQKQWPVFPTGGDKTYIQYIHHVALLYTRPIGHRTCLICLLLSLKRQKFHKLS